MELTISLAILAGACLALALLRWLESRPVELGTVRYMPYMSVMILCAVVILVSFGHVVVLLLTR